MSQFGAPPNEFAAILRHQLGMVDRLTKLNQALMEQAARDREEFKRVLERQAAIERRVPEAKYIEDIPGRREPFCYSMDITIPADSTVVQPGSVVITQDGPFVATGLFAAYRITDANATAAQRGKWRPVSSADPAFGISPTFVDPAVLQPIDFEIELTDGSSQRNLQNIPISSHMIARGREFWWNFDIGWFLERSSTITARVTPLHNMDFEGILKVSFPGYKVLQPIDWKP